MPTKNPRIFLTLAEADLAKVDALAAKHDKTRPWVLRYALRKLARAELKP